MQIRIDTKSFRLTAAGLITGLALTAFLIAGAAAAETKTNIGHFTLANGL